MIKQQITSKYCETSVRVIETLLLLLNNKLSTNDILNYFRISHPDSKINNKEVILKYFNTLKVAGYEIQKEKEKYYINTSPKQINFTEKELEAKELLENIITQFPKTKNIAQIKNLFQNIDKHYKKSPLKNTSSTQVKLDIKTENIEKTLEKLEQYCKDKQKLKIEIKDTKENKTIIATPLEIIFKNNHFVFSTYTQTTNNITNIPLNKIIKIEQFPTIANTNAPHSTISFELKDRLAKAYKLKDGEKIIDIKQNGNIVVTNNTEDKNELIERLLRYGKFCEILTPKTVRDEIKTIIKNAIKNYE
ncbi:MAG: WYL domain-containing protein [bacterium]|nr:WYL domain-containing protein [bacterium]